jgi:outer membrane lipoprotein LolB
MKTIPHIISSILLGISMTAVLSSCSTTKPLTSEQMARPRNYQESVTMTGKINIQYQQNDKTETLTGNFEWQQNSGELSITLSSPLGQTIAIIRENAQGASLEQSKQETRYASNVEQLLTESLGWSLPISGLRDWLQGFDRNQQGQRFAVPTRDNHRSVTQGWQLDFTSWQEDGEQIHPKLLNLYRRTDEVGDLKIRLAILEWN